MTLTTKKWQNYIKNTIKKYTKTPDPNPPTLLPNYNHFKIYSILDCKIPKKETFDWKKEGF